MDLWMDEFQKMIGEWGSRRFYGQLEFLRFLQFDAKVLLWYIQKKGAMEADKRTHWIHTFPITGATKKKTDYEQNDKVTKSRAEGGGQNERGKNKSKV